MGNLNKRHRSSEFFPLYSASRSPYVDLTRLYRLKCGQDQHKMNAHLCSADDLALTITGNKAVAVMQSSICHSLVCCVVCAVGLIEVGRNTPSMTSLVRTLFFCAQQHRFAGSSSYRLRCPA